MKKKFLLSLFMLAILFTGSIAQAAPASAAVQTPYVIDAGDNWLYAKVWGNPNETVYINWYASLDGGATYKSWMPTETAVLDSNGLYRTDSVKYLGKPAYIKVRVYYFSNGNNVWSQPVYFKGLG